MDFGTTFSNILSLFLLIIPGFVLVKCKLLKPTHLGILVTVLLFVNQPFIMVHSFLSKDYQPSLLKDMGLVLLISVVSQLAILLIAKLFFKFDKNIDRGRAYAFASSLGNVGFMGIPVIAVMLPNNAEAILYVSIFLTTFNLLAWTVGVYFLTGEKKYISLKKAIFNPPMIALIIALPLFFFNVKLPEAVMQPIKFLADMNTPLAMIILGARFACVKFKELFIGWGVYATCFLKLIITPLLVYVCMMPFTINITVKTVILALSAMPSANLVLMLCEKYQKDVVAATKGLMLTTLFSGLSVPIIMMLPL